MMVRSTKVYFQTIYAVKEYDIKNMQDFVAVVKSISHNLQTAFIMQKVVHLSSIQL